MLNEFLNKLSGLIEEVRSQEDTPVQPVNEPAAVEPEPEVEEVPAAAPSTDVPPVRIVLEDAHYAPVHELLVAVQERKNKIQQNAARVALAQAEMMAQIYGLEQDAQELIADLRLKYEVPVGTEWELHVPGEESPAFFAKKEVLQEED